MSGPLCFHCGKELDLAPGKAGRGDTCPNCRSDVRVCFNCRHYDANSYNECAEPMAERVVEKNRSNFCDYFVLEGLNKTAGKGGAKSKEDLLKSLDALFKK